MSATGDATHQAGFTLIELLVVLAIAGLIGGLGFPRLQTALAGAEARATISNVAAGLRSVRAAARLRGEPLSFVVSRDSYGPAGATIAAPASVRLEGPPAIHFYPDGSSSGGALTVAGGRVGARIDIDHATGLARTR